MDDSPRPLVCVHCGWTGPAEALTVPPGHSIGVCPTCWDLGYETWPREQLGPLMEALAAPDAPPRRRKKVADWSEEEWREAERIERARVAHQQSSVVFETTVKEAKQLGLGFMREEFRVADRRDPRGRRR